MGDVATSPLDRSIAAALISIQKLELEEPAALFLMATGVDLLPERLESATTVQLGELDGTPPAWAAASLIAGRLGDVPVWLLEDLGLEAGARDGAAAWESGWPCWLAARHGAHFLVHASAGASLDDDLARGSIALVTDHVNLSGQTPLRGLGQSQIGPMFPDVSTLHDDALAAAARAAGRASGLELVDTVTACTLGPSLETPAERAFERRAGCTTSVQGLAVPLLSAAHAGLRACCLIVVVEQPGERLDLVRLLEGAERAAPALEDLLVGMGPALAQLAAALEDEL